MIARDPRCMFAAELCAGWIHFLRFFEARAGGAQGVIGLTPSISARLVQTWRLSHRLTAAPCVRSISYLHRAFAASPHRCTM